MPEPTRSPARFLWALLVVAAAAWILWPRDAGRRPAPLEDVLLAAETPLGSDGALFAFRMERPGEVEIDVDLVCSDPETTPATWAEVGPPAPVEPPAGNYYLPDPTQAHRWRVEGTTTAPVRRTLFTVGSYALRIEPFPVAMGEMPPRARIRVKVVPAGPGE